MIGIGVNCVQSPTNTLYPVTDLRSVGFGITSDRLLKRLAISFQIFLREWNLGSGFPAIRERWLTWATGVGQTIKVCLAGRRLIGKFEGLGADGRLLLRLDDGTLREIVTGEVFLDPK